MRELAKCGEEPMAAFSSPRKDNCLDKKSSFEAFNLSQFENGVMMASKRHFRSLCIANFSYKITFHIKLVLYQSGLNERGFIITQKKERSKGNEGKSSTVRIKCGSKDQGPYEITTYSELLKKQNISCFRRVEI